ncbi:uncharacterized protein F4812DRAFT_463150 [Daldinia caldariorum]|uniref:uncharacterized protein n=1 Tax=Daldinia caldariorum TaxID=326644 RepID=UPI002007BDDC|nr:uncharacterized protein F4812DRAFT_463150 [Daldinia caldariorum]KAI1464091.1 hypothetical protein F4812DRAFT_463150 [Daldinia caldariorum]
MDDDDDSQYRYVQRDKMLDYPPNTPFSYRRARRPPPPEPHRPCTWFELPADWPHWYPAIVRCPEVTTKPQWNFSTNFGKHPNQLMMSDKRTAHRMSRFSLPLEEYTTQQILAMPQEILFEIIADWHRSPLLSFQSRTRNNVSRISPYLGLRGLRDHVPKVRRVFRDRRTRSLVIIMDFIEGGNLYALWPRLRAAEKDRISKQIVALIRTMQTYTSELPGALGTSRARAFVHPLFPPTAPLDMQAYRQHLACIVGSAHARYHMGPVAADLMRVDRLVLANMHLDAGSFLVDGTGKLCIVGWGKSGFYAPEAEIAICTYLIPVGFAQIIARLVETWSHKHGQMVSLRAVASWLDEQSAL